MEPDAFWKSTMIEIYAAYCGKYPSHEQHTGEFEGFTEEEEQTLEKMIRKVKLREKKRQYGRNIARTARKDNG